MQLFDTATRVVKTVTPRDGRVGMYVCGITPYDGGHVGHAFTYHTFDIITRRLHSEGVAVRSVRNVTDVDDDILRVARERGVSFRTLADVESRRFDADMVGIGLLPVDASPRASTSVHRMVQWIERLVESDAAYGREGWVYFDVDRFPEYGSLSRLGTTSMLELSRLRGGDPDDPRKRNPLDFVLWQPSADGEPSWPSPWSMGRPGWHIECTVLSATELTLPIDLHGGGDDLIYPHHESELAQALAVGVPAFCRHWVHVAMVGYQGTKMSKSLGNLVFVRDLVKTAPAGAVRLMLCAHHYRAPWEYNDAEIASARARFSDYQSAMNSELRFTHTEAQAVYDDFVARIDDDLDTPGALAILDEVAARPVVPGDEHVADVTAADVMTPLLTMLGVRTG
ncbi:MAG TPA: cysteine--tRNA ligase [Candidatus Dormibacteraeota bacterium]|nr:cysteine--tRNA ligase [Candidatus Dormibacteraeota bacterium]